MSDHEITCSINGETVSGTVEARLLASDFIRHSLKLTGTHVGCEHGVCGACTIVVDGRATRSCLLFAVQLDGKTVQTIEGLATGPELSPLQEAFSRHHALQCGFCTPGILTTAHEFLQNEPSPTAERVRDVISGNICRCTGYTNIVDAIMDAAAHYRELQDNAGR